jgi:hypothetical protein
VTYPEFDATLTALKQGTAPVLKQDLLATYMLTPLGRKTKQPTSLVNKPLDIGKPKRQLIYTSCLYDYNSQARMALTTSPCTSVNR